MGFDFTLEIYHELCSALRTNHYVCLTFSDYLQDNNKIKNKIAILRHDVDRKPSNALRMAELENKLGIRSTYYFRYPYTFNVDIIEKIIDLGHEIGYHYEVLSKTNGDCEKAKDLFKEELSKFREIYFVKTICMHGSPLSKYDNRSLWKAYDFKSFGIIGDFYLSIDKDIDYFSDTGRNWNLKNKSRDYIIGKTERFLISTTSELIDLIEGDKISKICIVAHPERWTAYRIEWFHSYFKDYIYNIGRYLLYRNRKML